MADNDNLVHTQSNSDDSDYDVNCSNSVPELKGYLSKWTNYIHGWQPRFIVLKDGTLSYYKRYLFAKVTVDGDRCGDGKSTDEYQF